MRIARVTTLLAVTAALVAATAPPAAAATAAQPTFVPVVTTAAAPGYAGPAGSRTTTGSKAVALTFDDGPDAKNTPALLKLLAKHKVRATFCLVGVNVQRHPKIVRQIAAGGHTLCNHSWNHDLKLGKKPAATIRADLRKTSDAIRKAVPKAKIKYFRAPGGNFTKASVAEAKKLGMASIHWSVDPRDWEHKKGETRAQHRARIIAAVKKHTRRGSIVLSHDFAQPDTVEAYRTLIPWLKSRFTLIALP